MPAMLGKRFAVFRPNFFSPSGRPAAAAVEIFIQSVLPTQPGALAFVAGQHFQFLLKGRRNVDNKIGR